MCPLFQPLAKFLEIETNSKSKRQSPGRAGWLDVRLSGALSHDVSTASTAPTAVAISRETSSATWTGEEPWRTAKQPGLQSRDACCFSDAERSVCCSEQTYHQQCRRRLGAERESGPAHWRPAWAQSAAPVPWRIWWRWGAAVGLSRDFRCASLTLGRAVQAEHVQRCTSFVRALLAAAGLLAAAEKAGPKQCRLRKLGADPWPCSAQDLRTHGGELRR